jgi:hypothetical protein
MARHTQPKANQSELDVIKTIQRGLVLSEAMKKLGHQSEVALLKKNRHAKQETTEIAHHTLMHHYIAKYGQEIADDLMSRYLHQPTTIRYPLNLTIKEADAYAQGLLKPIPRNTTQQDIIDYLIQCRIKGKKPSTRTLTSIKIAMELKHGSDTPQATALVKEALADAKRTQNEERQQALAYHQIGSKHNGWTIEIIGEMPNTIGLSRHTNHKPN